MKYSLKTLETYLNLYYFYKFFIWANKYISLYWTPPINKLNAHKSKKKLFNPLLIFMNILFLSK